MAVRRRGRDVPLDAGGAGRGVPRARPPTWWSSCTASARPTSHWDRRRAGDAAAATASRLAAEHRLDPGLPAREHRPADRRERRRAGLAARRPGGRLADRRTPDRAGRALDGRPGHARRLRGRAPTPAQPLDRPGHRRGHPRHAAPRRAARARASRSGARALGLLPESAPFGRILEYRSVGILDLRGGLAHDVQNLPHARYHLVAATLAALAPAPGQRGARRPAGALPVGDRTPAPRAGDVPGRRRAAHPGRTTSTCSTTRGLRRPAHLARLSRAQPYRQETPCPSPCPSAPRRHRRPPEDRGVAGRRPPAVGVGDVHPDAGVEPGAAPAAAARAGARPGSGRPCSG